MELTTSSEHWNWLRNPKQLQRRATRRASEARDRNPLFAASAGLQANVPWRNGRKSWLSSVASLSMVTVPPALTFLCWITLEGFQGSLFGALTELFAVGPTAFASRFAPTHDWRVTAAFFSWVLFQALLYTVLPGLSTGQLTHGGKLLGYRTNGFFAWVLTVLGFTCLSLSGLIDPSIIARHWGSIIITINVYGYILSAIAFIKAYCAPSHPEDRVFSGMYPLLRP